MKYRGKNDKRIKKKDILEEEASNSPWKDDWNFDRKINKRTTVLLMGIAWGKARKC